WFRAGRDRQMINDLIVGPGGELVDEDGRVIVAKGIALATEIAAVVPLPIANAGRHGLQRWAEFFTAQIANPNTRAAYLRATTDFFEWLAARGVIDLDDISSYHVAAYRDEMS